MLRAPSYLSELEAEFERFLVTDEFYETVYGLYQIHNQLLLAKTDNGAWKWVLLTAHNTLQSACVCILTETSGVGALDKKSTKEVLERLNDGVSSKEGWPDEKLADFRTLIRRVSKLVDVTIPEEPDWSVYDQPMDLLRLHLYRNAFSHYKSSTWLLEIGGLPRIVRNSVAAIGTIIESTRFKRFNRFLDYDCLPYFAAIYDQLDALELNLSR